MVSSDVEQQQCRNGGESPLPAGSCREVLKSVSTEMISSYRKLKGPINGANSPDVGTNWKSKSESPLSPETTSASFLSQSVKKTDLKDNGHSLNLL